MGDSQSEALNKMMGDMDGMEGESMFKKPKGVDITISIVPNTGGEDDEYPEGHEESMCHGGCAYHKGGIVEPETDESVLPPFLRKKKK